VQLVAEGKDLEQQVSTRRQGGPDRNDHPDEVTHCAWNGQLPRQRQTNCSDAVLARHKAAFTQ